MVPLLRPVFRSPGDAHDLRPIGPSPSSSPASPCRRAASVVTDKLDVDFAANPYPVAFDPTSSLIFTLVDPSFFAYNPAGVSTTGTTQVLSLGAPFYNPSQPTSFFSNRGGSIGPDTLGQYLGYATPAAVPYSISESIVGFRFDLGQGYQYGYADLAGSTLYGIRYETTPGVLVGIAAIPEPATWALLVAGIGMTGVGMRARRRSGVAA